MERRTRVEWSEIERDGVRLVARADLADALSAAGVLSRADPAQWRATILARLRGRGAPLALHLGEPVPDLVVKELRHGGALASLTADLFCSGARLQGVRELTALLASRGVAVPEVLFTREERVLGPWRRLMIGTRLVPGSCDLLEWLRAPQGERRNLLRDVGRLVAALHGAGVVHADLNLKNILVRGPELFIIDLETSTLRREVGERERVKNLERLLRSAAKHSLLGTTVSLADCARVLRGYDDQRWRTLFRHVQRRHQHWRPLHEIFWRLHGSAGVSK